MNTLKMMIGDVSSGSITENNKSKHRGANYQGQLIFGLLVLLWPMVQRLITDVNNTVGYIDPNIWLLGLFSLICFLVVTGLCWWLLQRFWMSLGLPALGTMVLSFKELTLWQQLGIYWLSFALLLLAGIGTLAAVL